MLVNTTLRIKERRKKNGFKEYIIIKENDRALAHIFDNPFLSTDCIPVFKLVLCKVDLRNGGFILNLIDSPSDVGLCVVHDNGEMGPANRTEWARRRRPDRLAEFNGERISDLLAVTVQSLYLRTLWLVLGIVVLHTLSV